MKCMGKLVHLNENFVNLNSDVMNIAKKIVNQNADILLLSSSDEHVKMLEIENQQMKIIIEERETELKLQVQQVCSYRFYLSKKSTTN